MFWIFLAFVSSLGSHFNSIILLLLSLIGDLSFIQSVALQINKQKNQNSEMDPMNENYFFF